MRSLVNYCYDLRFQKPVKGSVGKRLLEICLKEGIPLGKEELEELAERCNCDIRQSLNAL